MEYTFENVTTRRYTVGVCTITWVDNGNQRKAWLELNGKEMCKWEENEDGRWIVSAAIEFMSRLKKRTFSKENTFCIYACIGRMIEAPHAGLHWQDHHRPGTVGSAIIHAQAQCGLIFRVNSKYQTPTTRSSKNTADVSRTHLH
ncbi:hypothetical protein HOV30_gp094 [Erwinia phage Derbicus]|uniref:Uncharacterized protein n=2 Tax=Derbicusvirus derbicus TaxID=2734104 RepID=A0A482IL75_9CAUD|nr:hypothetical protein BIZ82_gp094 [Erwinia phage vB_EamM_EarlPhillipIV]YP_009821138.1 hypothetical protein HOV30_gp094 [Erwinia phage Derbicus]ANZ48943.1 hypothetical protein EARLPHILLIPIV_94 [Erwinia phage vB_EamM_EarlPhillipIV]QBP07520.1 hypothetical protein DERBICUS_94 [Erwinia phage Derbicus]